MPNLKLLATTVAEMLKADPQILGSSPRPGPHLLFLLVGLDNGLGKPQLHAKFEIAGFIYYGNIREFGFKRQISFLATLWGS